MQLKISAVLCTYNEDFYLEDCLNSISWADEIILCDMGSNDNTLNIAMSYGCKIYNIPKVDFIELTRQKAVDLCSNDWICFVDPDFIFPSQYIDVIKQKICLDPKITCVGMFYVNHYKGHPIKHGRWGMKARYPVLFRKNAMLLPTILHNGFNLKYGKTLKTGREVYLKHMWVRDEKHFYEKHNRYISKEGERRYKLGYKPSSWRKLRLVILMLYYYFKGGFLDGKIGYDLLKKSVWYEMQSEEKLKEIYPN
ncbi:MAG: glycosyltransferase family 2 protein [Methanosarcina sp.]|jgi:hypothetical protein|nr:glycosyltransferase family 2 protein [Methanosarcina sp.]MDD4521500.1 glycosyltransferase family 2 protein [Methanosarcina sp.]